MLKTLISVGKNSPGWGVPLMFAMFVVPPVLGWEGKGAWNATLFMVAAWALSLLIDEAVALRSGKISVRFFLSVIPATGCLLMFAVGSGVIAFADKAQTEYAGVAVAIVVAVSYMCAATLIWTKKYRDKARRSGASKFNFDGVDAAFLLTACLPFVFWDNAYAEGFPAHGKIVGGVIFVLWAWRRIRCAFAAKQGRRL